MATSGGMSLSDDIIATLAETITATNMETIAIKYMKIPFETVENLKYNDQGNAVALNRSLLNLWKCMNPADNQVQVSFGKTSVLVSYFNILTCPMADLHRL